MCDPVITSEIAKAIPVIIGGLLAMFGGLGSQVLVHRYTHLREQTKFRREKLEGLIKAVHAHRYWITSKLDREVYKKEDFDTPSPLPEAEMLQTLYFPELAQEMANLIRAQTPILLFIIEQALAHKSDAKEFIANYKTETFKALYQKYLSEQSTLIDHAAKLL